MQRMSEPQIVVLFVRTRTSPWPGVGTSNVRSSTVLLPGRIAPCICVGIRPMGPPGARSPGEHPGMANLSASRTGYAPREGGEQWPELAPRCIFLTDRTTMGEPAFISKQVESGAYYFLDLDPSPRAPLTVVCGGREVCGAAYRIDRRAFPYHSIELVASGRGSVTLDGTRHRLQPGALFRYGPGIAHEIAVEPGSRMLKYFVDFTGTACARLLADGPWSSLQPLQLAEPARAQAIYEELQRVGARETPLAGRLCALLLQQLVLLAADEAVPAAGLDSAAWATYRRCREHMESALPLAAVAGRPGGRLRHERGPRLPAVPSLRRPLAVPGPAPSQDGARRIAAARPRAPGEAGRRRGRVRGPVPLLEGLQARPRAVAAGLPGGRPAGRVAARGGGPSRRGRLA